MTDRPTGRCPDCIGQTRYEGDGFVCRTCNNGMTDDLPARLDERVRQHREFKWHRVSVDYTDRDADRDERAAVRIRELEAENARLHGLTEGDPSSVYFELADARSRVQELEQKVDDWRVSVQLLEYHIAELEAELRALRTTGDDMADAFPHANDATLIAWRKIR